MSEYLVRSLFVVCGRHYKVGSGMLVSDHFNERFKATTRATHELHIITVTWAKGGHRKDPGG